MKSRKSITSKMEIFYKVVEAKRKCQKTRLQTDQKFKQKKIFDLNKKYPVDIFFTFFTLLPSKYSGGLRLSKNKTKNSKRISPYEIMKISVDTMNSLLTAKYKQVPARSGRRSIHTYCPAQEKRLARKIL